MIGAALDDDVARADSRLSLVHEQHDLTGQHHAEVDGLGAMERPMTVGLDLVVGCADGVEHGVEVGPNANRAGPLGSRPAAMW